MNRTLFRKAAAVAAGAAVALTAGGALTGSASAATYPGAAYAGPYEQATMSDGSSAPAAPTATLANLSNNMKAASKGVSAAIHFDPGLVSGGSSVAVTVKWGNVA